MGDTSIEWTDKTWNPVVGCEQISAGCGRCYAKSLHDMRHKAYKSGKQLPAQYAVPFETVQLMPGRLTDPLRWRAPKRVFVNSVSDLFHEDVPFEFIDKVFAVMALAREHTFQVLTKRAERMADYMSGERQAGVSDAARTMLGDKGAWLNNWPLRNVHIGVSVEDQQRADERIPQRRRHLVEKRCVSSVDGAAQFGR